jgi:hypothetical protein
VNPDFEFSDFFAIYPNPASNILNIAAKDGNEMHSMSVYNTLGQLVLAVPNATGISEIDISDLQAGNYFVKMVSDLGISTMRFIKK